MWYTKTSFTKIAQHSEWWITDTGAQYADGDIGDSNHAMIAEDYILRNLGYDLSDDMVTTDSANTIMDNLAENGYGVNSPYWEAFVKYAQRKYRSYKDNPWWYNVNYDHYIEWLHKYGLPKTYRMPSKDVTRHLQGLRKDPIQHVIQNYNWARIHGKNIELYDLDNTTLNNLANGLYETNGEEVEDMTFNIHVNKYGKTLFDVPYQEIENGSVRNRLKEVELAPVAPLRKEQDLPFNDPTLKKLYKYPGAKTTLMWYRYAVDNNQLNLPLCEDETKEDESRYYDFIEQMDNAHTNVLENFTQNPQQRQKWTVVPAARIKRIWNDYVKYGFVRDEKGLEDIVYIMIQNTLKLNANTALGGHKYSDPIEVAHDYEYEWTEEQDEMFGDHILDEQGQWRLSDTVLNPLMEDAFSLYKARTSGEKIFIIDRMLNRVHPRSDIAALFVEGGSQTLAELSQ